MLNTYEHGWSDGIHGRHSILRRFDEYERGFRDGHRSRRRDRHLAGALGAVTVLTMVFAIGFHLVMS